MVGLLGMLLVVALPQLTVPDTLSVETLADQLAVDLRLTRQLAISGRVNYALEFSPATPPYTDYVVRNLATLAVEADFPKEIPPTVTVTGRQRFIVTPSGCVDDDGLGGCAGSDGTVTLTAGSETAEVRVYWYRGRVMVVGP